MVSLTSQTFKVEVNADSDYAPRAARRVILNSDDLKAAKLCTGDVVALSSVDNSGSTKVGFNCLHYPCATLVSSLFDLLLIEICGGCCVALPRVASRE